MTTDPRITAEEVARDFQDFLEAQGYHNATVKRDIVTLVNTDNRQQAAIDGLVATSANLVAGNTRHEGEITCLRSDMDQVQEAVKPENLRMTITEVHRESSKLVGVGAAIGAVIGFFIGLALTSKNTVTSSDKDIKVVVVNLGIARAMIVLAAVLVFGLLGALIMNGSSSSKTTVTEEGDAPKRSKWKFWQKKPAPAPAPAPAAPAAPPARPAPTRAPAPVA